MPPVGRLSGLVALIALVAALGCGAPVTPGPTGGGHAPLTLEPPADTAPLPPPLMRDHPGIPWAMNGVEVQAGVIALIPGRDVCGHQDLALLTIGWPLGRRAVSSVDARQYARDTTGQFASLLRGDFRSHVSLPEDARFTGYLYGSDQLWVSPTTADDEVYLVRGGVVEAWPRADVFFACG